MKIMNEKYENDFIKKKFKSCHVLYLKFHIMIKKLTINLFQFLIVMIV